MNDCLWCCMGVCDGKCQCDRYMSMNSDEGRKLTQEYEELIEKACEPVKKQFAKEHGGF